MYMFLYFQRPIKLGNAMKSASSINEKSKYTPFLLISILVISSLNLLMPIASAVTPPTIPGNEEYMSDFGVLDSDTYFLYPYEKKSLNIGFSKYGEMINLDDEMGLEYDGIDAFANPNVPMEEWSNGWVMNLYYTDQSIMKRVWAYAMTTDWGDADGIGGEWRQAQMNVVPGPGDMRGGRRTSGYAESDDIRLIYDGPRKAIYLLNTTIYDKDPQDDGTALVRLTIQVVFNKVKKYVLEIKDIKRIDNNKMTGPFQIEFSQRAEWDLGNTSRSLSYAEFYDNLTTKYYKHPFYYPEGDHNVSFDLAQIIDTETSMVGYAAFWPHTVSKWVTDVEHMTREDALTSMETFRYHIDLPEDETGLPDWITYDRGAWTITLPYKAIEYPRGCGDWDSRPWVFITKPGGEPTKLSDSYWEWNDASDRHLTVHWPWVDWKDGIDIIYKRESKGFEEQWPIPLECMPEDLFVGWPGIDQPSYGMESEPGVPYVRAEWDFDLDYDEPECSSHQFRLVSLYGVTDLHNAVDPDMDGRDYFRIDKEVIYQLYEVFNPWDLKDAALKETFRWAQKGPISEPIILDAHLHDKYGNDRPALLDKHEFVLPEKWDHYCEFSERVILFDADGELEPLLLSRPEDYVVRPVDFAIYLLDDFVGYEYYKVLYSTTPTEEAPHWFHRGRWEWNIIGEESLASDSIGSGMIGATWTDWKKVEMWLSGLDVQAEVYGPTIPHVFRRFDDTLPGRYDFYYDYGAGDYRSALRDDWSTPDGYDGTYTIWPYAVSSSNIIVVGGPFVNLAAEYFNDFTDAFIYSEYDGGFYAPGCWARTCQPSPGVSDEVDELWYSSTDVVDGVGHAIVSTYKDLNGTVGFIVYGYTAEDTYYACYALRGGLLAWLQGIQDGATTIILEIDYSSLHPVTFHVKEVLGPFTECTGAETNFKTGDYESNLIELCRDVVEEAEHLGISYKLVDLEWCAEIHPDP